MNNYKKATLALLMVATVVYCAWPHAKYPRRVNVSLSDSGREAVKSQNEFAFDMYRKLAGVSGDIVFSPTSLITPLALARTGANGATADELNAVLHLPHKGSNANGVGELSSKSELSLLGRELDLSNSIWLDQTVALNAKFAGKRKGNYWSEIRIAPLASDPNAAASTINAKLSRDTRGHIPNMVDAQSFGPNSVMVLASAAYFKADWAEPFPEQDSFDGTFYGYAGKQSQVRFMKQEGNICQWTSSSGFDVASLPYAGEEFEMLVVLPKASDGLRAIENDISERQYMQITQGIDRCNPAETAIYLPKFKFGSEFDLRETLQSLGLRVAFTPSADFSGMATAANGAPISIGGVKHRADIEVMETGTEAAAATVVYEEAAAVGEEGQVFLADHPFLFIIRDRRTNAVLFIGRFMNDPSRLG